MNGQQAQRSCCQHPLFPNKQICLASAIRFRSVPWMQGPLGLLGPDAAILPQTSLISPVECFLSLVLLAGSSGTAGSQQAQRAHWHRAAAAQAKAATSGKVSAATRWGRFCFHSSWRPCRRVLPELPHAGGGEVSFHRGYGRSDKGDMLSEEGLSSLSSPGRAGEKTSHSQDTVLRVHSVPPQQILWVAAIEISWREMATWSVVLIALHQPRDLPTRDEIRLLFVPTGLSSITHVCPMGLWWDTRTSHAPWLCL